MPRYKRRWAVILLALGVILSALGSGCAARQDAGSQVRADRYTSSGPYQHGVVPDAFEMGLGAKATPQALADAAAALGARVALPSESVVGPPSLYEMDTRLPAEERTLLVAYEVTDVRLAVIRGWTEKRLLETIEASVNATDLAPPVAGKESSIDIRSDLGPTVVTVTPGEVDSVPHGRVKVEARVLFVRDDCLYMLRSREASIGMLVTAAKTMIASE